MSRRFGRNQRRKLREQIEAAKRTIVTTRNSAAYERQRLVERHENELNGLRVKLSERVADARASVEWRPEILEGRAHARVYAGGEERCMSIAIDRDAFVFLRDDDQLPGLAQRLGYELAMGLQQYRPGRGTGGRW